MIMVLNLKNIEMIFFHLLSIFMIFTSCIVDIPTINKNKIIEKPTTVEINNNLPYNYFFLGKSFRSNDSTQSIYNTHSSWTHSNVSYDNKTNNIIIFYNVKPMHNIVFNKVAMRTLNEIGEIGNAIVVADREKEGISCKSLASGIDKNGNYLSLVGILNNHSGNVLGTYVYRSVDKGKTWSSHPMTVNKDIVKAFHGDVSGFLLLKNGRILTLACHETTRLTRILYSDDDGFTWHFATIPPCYKHTEPAWCELSDGTIICYLRNSIAEDGYYSPVPALFMKSIDGGLIWSTPIKSKSVLNMTEANGQLLYHENSKMVEFIHHSRCTEKDGFSSIFQMAAAEDDAKNDNMGREVRIMQLPPQDKGGDSGYIGGCLSKDEFSHIFFYSGTQTNADIYYLKGYKKETTEELNND